MTEDEAKTMDCIGPPNCGREEEPIPGGYRSPVWKPRRFCIGSACGMGWRWRHDGMNRAPDGYCGLAGKP